MIDRTVAVLRGAAARLAANMDASLSVPVATSSRVVSATRLVHHRRAFNEALADSGRVSVSQLVAYALLRAIAAAPHLNGHFTQTAGKPSMVTPTHVNLGVAVTVDRPGRPRSLLVPTIKAADLMSFADFGKAYDDVVGRARRLEAGPEDLSGATVSLTNTGVFGTSHSVPRLLPGQGLILAVGSVGHPPEFRDTPAATLAGLGIGPTATLSVTFDHRIVQGADAALLLRAIDELLQGGDSFYEDIAASLGVCLPPASAASAASVPPAAEADAVGVAALIHAYRAYGHLAAATDPLSKPGIGHPELDPAAHGLRETDTVRTGTAGTGGAAGVGDLVARLTEYYCGTIGWEYMHLPDPQRRRWFQERVERPRTALPDAQRARILQRLIEATGLESYLNTKYVRQKRFSLEGGEALVILLDRICERAAGADLAETVIAMSHRGRLNVLVNVMDKPPAELFAEFEGAVNPLAGDGSGDVKYNFGAGTTRTTTSGAPMRMRLLPNASHLEAVGPVLQGFARARQDLADRAAAVLAVQVHGDAAVTGQGVAAETLNMSRLRGFSTAGTIHIVIDNQVGFTTTATDGRSGHYPTNLARVIDAPVLHVNGDDPDACAHAVDVAFAYRQEFGQDVFIHLLCYRRHGHNELEDPSTTLPGLYRAIAAKPAALDGYTRLLVEAGVTTPEQSQELRLRHNRLLAGTRAAARTAAAPAPATPVAPTSAPAPATAVARTELARVLTAQGDLPTGFQAHPKILGQLQRRAAALAEDTIDWAAAETLAIGSLLAQGVAVRLSGQDCRRGTFSQRHHVVVDQTTGAEHTPLAHLASGQARYAVYDSMLSEFAALGFEYGYSAARPQALVIWEAQFGDFANGAQVIIDEYLAAGQRKWGQRSALTLLLPHGQEGQGPNHSSARVERFLQLCAEQNLTVAMPSLPSSYFHLLRRQGLAGTRPLVVFTPKSMLRLRAAASTAAEFTQGGWSPVLADTTVDARTVSRVLLCSGKLYWDLAGERAAARRDDIAIVRLEQLYPFPGDELRAALDAYPAEAEVCWVQEEPENQGAARFVRSNLPAVDPARPLAYVSPPELASTALASPERYQAERRDVLARAFRRDTAAGSEPPRPS
ncbi:multifunctional oxoglutarate decarboxylase/oxoglutarate dehydrogenase thiamine pyrophosphate-binding subunit/dihydrolipoyllysine-residue succinyltransferase subunit [Catellatospora tritici]|uniref:multifunctional oxoglutarate decarboxylase/oxoglutarate dehydrogenase thiamine pyrophosphate-binding subunit/dihydrolipoyllysine-residue succinyltransferase subunit n=1 Tax=Catellatospora tritici TaxID=2851566 RepID=UPI001C2DCB4A|nr:multifunctional oxoglutarate decarboxylase/oxoglutarate dehydrogenase thiamine pyrophosphate-binding subunit/dihydrolipoyllysine-residue succinyltransferase subunit [Catellatospora tritici]MBV1849577.1 multifunctional oxoglutarate decarboxylase/oxoglutarate dehydrogenase thiamine pyrophosphate-binding subunit/dihydrolipoyllysine-residue succinyltransferase subunit [Catellatospora tritici]